MNCVVWLLGRGASIACNLGWCVPEAWLTDDRTILGSRIKAALLEEMARPSIDARPYRLLLDELARRSASGWEHRFLTTNWDTLLQRDRRGNDRPDQGTRLDT